MRGVEQTGRVQVEPQVGPKHCSLPYALLEPNTLIAVAILIDAANNEFGCGVGYPKKVGILAEKCLRRPARLGRRC